MLADRIRMGLGVKSITLVAGDVVVFSKRNFKSNNTVSYVKVREIKINASGTIKVIIDLWKSPNVNGRARGRIRINNITKGDYQTNALVESPAIYSNEYPISKGDLISIWLATEATQTASVYNTHFEIKCDKVVPSNIFTEIL